MNADERTTLEGWLDFYRATLASKCEGLDDDQLSLLRKAADLLLEVSNG